MVVRAARDRIPGREPEGTFYLFPESPLADDVDFTQALDREGVLVLPGRMFETPGFFRISLTATMETIEAGLPRFAAAFRAVAAAADADRRGRASPADGAGR